MRRFALLACAFALALAACSSGSSHRPLVDPTTAPTTTVAAADVAARPSAGCTATTKVAAGELKVNTTSDGTPRWYLRHVPPTYTGTTPMPLVLDLHGYEEGAAIHSKISGLGPFGDTHGFITLTPQGSGTAVALWNTALGSPDVKFIGNLLDEAERTLCVDQARVFVTGLSNGAFMTSAVACAYSARVAAVAPVAGIRDIAGCTFSRPVPVLAFHGTADPFVSYTGGLGPKALALPAPNGHGTLGGSGGAKGQTKGPSIPKITADWAKRNGCGITPTDTKLTSDVTTITFPCPAGADVVLQRITGGGHSWPGSTVSVALGPLVGKTTLTISANALMWTFFQAHPLRG